MDSECQIQKPFLSYESINKFSPTIANAITSTYFKVLTYLIA